MVKVIKVSGESEEYSEQKILASAKRVGVGKDLREAVLREVRAKLYDGIHTSEIFQIIKTYLKESGNEHLESKYNLKEALSELGPSGYPFEKFVAALLSATGYQTEINQVMSGSCVQHEVDVVAQKDGQTYLIEAKFHKNPSQRTDVKVALYIYARYLDLALGRDHYHAWIVTNTRFSTDALTYATCRDIRVTSWGYPKNEGIMDLIEKTSLHPVTMLAGLTQEDKTRLLLEGIVTCREFAGNPAVGTMLPKDRYERVLSLARRICKGS